MAAKKRRSKVSTSPAGVHRLVKVDTFRVTMLVHIEDEDNDPGAKLFDLEQDLPGMVPWTISDVSTEYEYDRHVPAHQVQVRPKRPKTRKTLTRTRT